MKLYVFESCPYCTRVRIFIGLKGLKCDIEYICAGEFPEELTQQLSSLTVPILELENQEGTFLQESLDIIKFLDASADPAILKKYEATETIIKALATLAIPQNMLCYPRMPFLALPELGSTMAQQYFSQSRSERLGISLRGALAATEQYIPEVASALIAIENSLHIEALLSGMRSVNMDDAYVFAELRNLTMVKELNLPRIFQEYISLMAKQTHIALFTPIDKHGVQH